MAFNVGIRGNQQQLRAHSMVYVCFSLFLALPNNSLDIFCFSALPPPLPHALRNDNLIEVEKLEHWARSGLNLTSRRVMGALSPIKVTHPPPVCLVQEMREKLVKRYYRQNYCDVNCKF